MVLAASSYEEHVTQRILEMVEPTTAWYRRLWQPGTLLLAKELLEAGDPALGVTDYAKDDVLGQFMKRLMLDPGCGDAKNRANLRKVLPVKAERLILPGHEWQVLAQYTAALDDKYMSTWATALGPGQDATAGAPASAERAARLLTAHLLESGWSPRFTHRWLTYHLKHDASVYTLSDLCDMAQLRLRRGPGEFEVCVLLAADPPMPRPVPDGWLTSRQVRHWRAANIPNSRPVRQHGALLVTVSAHDIYAAADLARERVASIVTRFRVGGRRDLSLGSDMWVKGVGDPLPVLGSPRRVEVHAFERTEGLWRRSLPPELEAAMELMGPLDRGPASAATTGAWSAIESSLIGPGDTYKLDAAMRLGLIVACGFARGELTTLAWAHRNSSSDALAGQIEKAASNKERAQLALDALSRGAPLQALRISDRHAMARISGLVDNPHGYVASLSERMCEAFKALYRQRNLLSHAGGTNAVAMRPTLSRVAPLVGAGMDRIAHASLTRGESAIPLAARARIQLDSLRQRGIVGVLDLLE